MASQKAKTNNNYYIIAVVPLAIVIVLCCSFVGCVKSNPDSIYSVLSAHGLPAGLMPKGVKEFKFDENGRFEVHLDKECNAKFESELHYERNISGTLSYGQIGDLLGITTQELFLWFPVKGIRVDIPSSGLIYFDVGVVFKQYSLSLFETPLDCMAGTVDELAALDFHDNMNIVQVVSKGQFRKLWPRFVGTAFGRNVL